MRGQSPDWDWHNAIVNFMVSTGLSEDAFWDATPRQTYRAIKAAEARTAASDLLQRWHTWHAAALPNVKEFPKFDEFVRPAVAAPAPRQSAQSGEAQIAAFRSLRKKKG